MKNTATTQTTPAIKEEPGSSFERGFREAAGREIVENYIHNEFDPMRLEHLRNVLAEIVCI